MFKTEIAPSVCRYRPVIFPASKRGLNVETLSGSVFGDWYGFDWFMSQCLLLFSQPLVNREFGSRLMKLQSVFVRVLEEGAFRKGDVASNIFISPHGYSDGV